MPNSKTTTSAEGRDLILTRVFDAAPHKVFNAWKDPELIKKWFAPKPYSVPSAEIDLRSGGSTLVVMRSPEGMDMVCPGVFLEVVPNKKIVMTDAFTTAWEPAEKPFMTVIVTFEEQEGITKYTALVRHWSIPDRERHEQMGFHEGWTTCAEQLAQLVE